MADSLIVACDAGIPVCFVTMEELALDLVAVAQELIVLGSEVDMLTEPEHHLQELARILDDLDHPGLFVVCRRGDGLDVPALRAAFDRHSHARHRWLDLEVTDDVIGSVLRPVAREVADLQRVLESVVEIGRIDPSEVSDVRELPRPPVQDDEPPPDEVDIALASLTNEPVVSSVEQAVELSVEPASRPPTPAPSASARPRPERTRKSMPWGFVAAGAALGVAVVFVATSGPPQEPSAAESPQPPAVASTQPAPAASVSPAARRPPAPPPAVEAEGASPEPPAEVEFQAQGPAEEGVAVAEDAVETRVAESPISPEEGERSHRLDPLGRAIYRGEVVVHGDMLMTVLEGERTWRDAMTACKKRPYAGLWGWRVPGLQTARNMARAGALPPSTVWSSTRGDRVGRVAYALEDGTRTVRVAKEDVAPTTVCVRSVPAAPQVGKD